MQVVEVLAVDEQIEHVVALPTHLQTHFHPVQLGGLKELGGLERAEEVPERKIENIYSFCCKPLNLQGKTGLHNQSIQHLPLFLCLWWSMFESIEHIIFEQFLVRHAHFHWLPCRAVFTVPETQSLFF